jgi:hypothetical protein
LVRSINEKYVNPSADFGVKTSHFTAFGEALIWGLQQQFGPAFTPEMQQAWIVLYDAIQEEMMHAASKSEASLVAGAGACERVTTRDGTVGRSDATERSLPLYWDIDPARVMRPRLADSIRASSPSGLREQAGHMTASDFCAAREVISCQAGAIHT